MLFRSGEFGVSWRYYTLSQVSSIANYSGPASTCAEEDVEGIWILAYEWVNGDGSFQGKQVLDRPNKNVHVAQVQPPYSTGWYKFVGPTVLADTKDWTDNITCIFIWLMECSPVLFVVEFIKNFS